MEQRNDKYREMIWINGKLYKGPWLARKTDAKSWKANMIRERDQAKLFGIKIFELSKKTFKEFSEDWFRTKIVPHKAPSTISAYRRILNLHLLPLFGEKVLNEISIKIADGLVYSLKESGHKVQGINHIIGILKQILKEAEKEGLLPKSPLTYLKPLKQKEAEVWSFWSESEINKFFLKTQHLPLAPLFITAIFTGMRRGELAGLQWDCVDFERRAITVKRIRDRHGFRETTKTGKNRIVPIHESLLPVLLDLFRKRQDQTPFLFLDTGGLQVGAHHLGRDFDRYQKLAGMESLIRFHDLRHTFASQFVMKGGSLYVLREILGHSDIKMTQRYAHLSPDHLIGSTDFMKFQSLQNNPTPNLTHGPLSVVG